MNHLFPGFPAGRFGAALLVLRVVVGAAFILHGWPKVNDVAGFAEKTGVPWILGAAAAYSELVGGVLLILGLLTPVASGLLAVVMLVALFKVHLPAGHTFVNPGGPNFELAALYLAIFV